MPSSEDYDGFDPAEIFPATDTLKFLGIMMADGASPDNVARYVLQHREAIEQHLKSVDIVVKALDETMPPGDEIS